MEPWSTSKSGAQNGTEKGMAHLPHSVKKVAKSAKFQHPASMPVLHRFCIMTR
jgi:hypothetical protein